VHASLNRLRFQRLPPIEQIDQRLWRIYGRGIAEEAGLVHAVAVHAIRFGFSAYPAIPEVRPEFSALWELHHAAAAEEEKKDLNDNPENIEETRETWWFWLWIQFLVEHGLFPFLSLGSALQYAH
jgi:hypothetical protein